MNINVKSIEVKYNDKLGVFPVSTFIELSSDGNVLTEIDFFNKIEELECVDIIFYGDFLYNQEVLKWIIPMLTSVHDHVTCIQPIDNSIFFPANRYIFTFKYEDLKKHVSRIEGMNERYIILLRMDSIAKLKVARKIALDKQTKAMMFYDTKLIDPDKVLSEKIYDIMPYTGDLDFE